MTIDELRALAAGVLALDRPATKGPWLLAPGNFVVVDCLNGDVSTGKIVAEVPCQSGNPADLTLIARYRTLAPRLARAIEPLLRAVEAARKVARKCQTRADQAEARTREVEEDYKRAVDLKRQAEARLRALVDAVLADRRHLSECEPCQDGDTCETAIALWMTCVRLADAAREEGTG